MKKLVKESTIQQQIVEYTRNTFPHCIIYSIPNEGKRNPRFAHRMKLQGLLHGVADLCILFPGGHSMYVEVKRQYGTVSENQERFRDNCQRLGFYWCVVYSLEEFIIEIYTYISQVLSFKVIHNRLPEHDRTYIESL